MPGLRSTQAQRPVTPEMQPDLAAASSAGRGDMRPSVKFNPSELDALKGLPLAARVLYVEGIRPFMDFGTGLVGACSSPDKSISLQSLAEVLYVEPRQGRTGTGSRSRKHARVCIETLIEAGLVASLSISNQSSKRLILRCLLADSDKSAQKKQGTNRAQEQDTNRAQSKANDNDALGGKETPNQGTPETPNQGTPPVSGNTHTQYRARARGLQPIPEDFQIDDAVRSRLITGGVPEAVAEFFIDEFKAANESSGFLSASWPAELVKFCKRERWRYDKQQPFEADRKSGPIRGQSRATTVHEREKQMYADADAREKSVADIHSPTGSVRSQVVVPYRGRGNAQTDVG